MSRGSKVIARTDRNTDRHTDTHTQTHTHTHTDTQTHMTENITYPHTRVVTIRITNWTWVQVNFGRNKLSEESTHYLTVTCRVAK